MTHPTQAAGAAERQAFEEWIVREAGPGAIEKWLGTEGYENARVQDYRTGWVACLDYLASTATATSAPTDAKSVAGSEHDPAVCDAAYQSALHEIAALKLKLAEAETKLDAYVDWCENMNTGPMFFEPQGDQS